MAKHEWGTKHTCSTCEAVFYDMKKTEPSCPSCDTKVRPIRSPSPPPAPPKPTPKQAAAEETVLDIETEDDLAMGDNQDDKELLEQVEDDVEDDMKEVIETGPTGETTD